MNSFLGLRVKTKPRKRCRLVLENQKMEKKQVKRDWSGKNSFSGQFFAFYIGPEFFGHFAGRDVMASENLFHGFRATLERNRVSAERFFFWHVFFPPNESFFFMD
jgi:hypothetical protein